MSALLARAALALALVALCGCATVPAIPAIATKSALDDDTDNDPLEPMNRKVFAFNQALDRTVIKPVAKTYRDVVPEWARDRIHAVLENLREPLTFANDVLQGRGGAASITAQRFLMNSIGGLGGLYDRASERGLPKQSGDFGQTLYVWGVLDGPYLVLPFFGPSSVRDGVGLGVDLYANPVGHIGSSGVRSDASIARTTSGALDQRSRNIESLETLEAASLDFYTYLRSTWRQYRRATLLEGKGQKPEDDLTDPGETPTSPAADPAARRRE